LVHNYAILQIVPKRTARPEGVGDYATLLANVLFERFGYTSHFILGTPGAIETPVEDCWPTSPVISRNKGVLAHELTEMCQDTQTQAVLLHVSGYGYQKRGAPFWLLNGLRAWRRRHKNVRLIGIFHELFATGRVWNSSFWLSQAQRYVTRELWRLCDHGLTNNHAYFNQLAAWRPELQDEISVKPVFSNVGEPENIIPFSDRPPDMAVFGRPGLEQGIYIGPQSDEAARVADSLGVQRIIDIGERIATLPPNLGKATVASFGRLCPRSVSQYLQNCRFGLLNYDIARLGKSGVLAAYAAHGVVPVCIGSSAGATDDLEEGRHFLRWPLRRVPEDLSEIQRNLTRWYQSHSIAKHAVVLNSWCGAAQTSKGSSKAIESGSSQ
jgi:hypothetical protein